MRMILGLVPFVLGLAACQTSPAGRPGGLDAYPAPYPGPPVDRGNYRAMGTEPFWDLVIGPRMTFTNRGTNVVVTEPTPPAQNGVAGRMYNGRRLRVNIVQSRCTDGMSNRTYPDTVQVSVDNRLYRGCGAPEAFFLEVDARGNPRLISARPGPATTLERTRWRVVRINGRAVPRKGAFNLDFDSGRIAAKFGCNSIAGPYSQSGTTLDVGALVSTRVACFDMSFENQANAILDQVMTVAVVGRNQITLSSTAGTIELQRR